MTTDDPGQPWGDGLPMAEWLRRRRLQLQGLARNDVAAALLEG